MEKFDLVLEATYHKFRGIILEESASADERQRYEVVITEAASALEKTKEFVKNNKGKLAALAGLAAAGGAGYAADKGLLGDKAQEVVQSGMEKAGSIVDKIKDAVAQH